MKSLLASRVTFCARSARQENLTSVTSLVKTSFLVPLASQAGVTSGPGWSSGRDQGSSKMSKRTTGRYERTGVGGEGVAAFVPLALPPTDPPLELSTALADRLRAAKQALVRLELAGEMVPSLDWFIYAFVR